MAATCLFGELREGHRFFEFGSAAQYAAGRAQPLARLGDRLDRALSQLFGNGAALQPSCRRRRRLGADIDSGDESAHQPIGGAALLHVGSLNIVNTERAQPLDRWVSADKYECRVIRVALN
jgi:hypothetical protein